MKLQNKAAGAAWGAINKMFTTCKHGATGDRGDSWGIQTLNIIKSMCVMCVVIGV